MTKNTKIFALLIALIAWFAVIAQYCLIMQNGQGTGLQITVRFFSFFTVLTNVMVAICFTYLLVSKKAGWLASPGTLTALTAYILVVGAVYNTVLRFMWQPQGMQMVVDELLHSVIPVLVILYWIFFVPKGTLGWTDTFPWLIYPAVYCLYVIIRGGISNEYPYPFMDVKTLGEATVTLNCAMLCGVFFGLFMVFAGLDKLMGKKKPEPRLNSPQATQK